MRSREAILFPDLIEKENSNKMNINPQKLSHLEV